MVKSTNEPINAPESDSMSPLEAGDIAGGLMAGWLVFVGVMVPSTINAFLSPIVAAYLPLILMFTLFWAVIASIAGYIAGGFAAKTRKPLKGTLIGVLAVMPIVVCYAILFLLGEKFSRESILAALFLVLFGAIIGGLSGCVAAIVGRRTHDRMVAKRQ
jgi:hypothetical protein